MNCTDYQIPDLPWQRLVGPLARAEDNIARLDERVLKSEIAAGWEARTDFLDALSSLWIEGETLHIEDLVLHDAMMDVRAPSHELTRAQSTLRDRRRIRKSAADWRLSPSLVEEALGRRRPQKPMAGFELESSYEPEDAFGGAVLDVIAATERSDEALSRFGREFVYDDSVNHTDQLRAWLDVVSQTEKLPPTLAAVIAEDAWMALDPLENSQFAGRLLAASLLRHRRKTLAHLTTLSIGRRDIPRALTRNKDPITRYLAGLDALHAAAAAGLRNHETWLSAKRVLERKARGRRSTSHLPALIDFLIAMPLVSATMISSELKISQRAALDLVAQLDVREITGRGRFRAWGIL